MAAAGLRLINHDFIMYTKIFVGGEKVLNAKCAENFSPCIDMHSIIYVEIHF